MIGGVPQAEERDDVVLEIQSRDLTTTLIGLYNVREITYTF